MCTVFLDTLPKSVWDLSDPGKTIFSALHKEEALHPRARTLTFSRKGPGLSLSLVPP